MSFVDRIRKVVFRRRSAYRALFTPGNSLSPAADIVLSDLRKFCRATTTPVAISPVTQTVDPIATGIAIGRLEVWHRIAQNIQLTDADLYRLVTQDQDGTDD